MSDHFIIQMHGHPGSGKSLVARGIAGATGAIVLDRDVVKSTMLEYGHDDDDIAPVAYEICLRMAGEIARQGYSVILDSTAYYPIIRNRGRQYAEEANAGYYIVDVVCTDEEELRRRQHRRVREARTVRHRRAAGRPLPAAGRREDRRATPACRYVRADHRTVRAAGDGVHQPMNPIVIQMHGLPGSGKSTLARAIAPRIGAIVLDKDVIKAALLRAGIPENKAGTAAYEVYFSQAQELISLGHSVILDNPVYWPIVEQRWKDICEQAGAPRLILECMLGDDEERARRLGIRHRLESQPATPGLATVCTMHCNTCVALDIKAMLT